MGTTTENAVMGYSDQQHRQNHEEEQGGKARYLSNLTRGKASNFYINGNYFFPGKRVVYNPQQFKDFPNYLDFLTEKLNPLFGAVRKIHTPHNGHRILGLKDIQEDKEYVAAGGDRFRHFRYDQITSPDRRKSPPFKYDASPVSHSRQFVSSGKIGRCVTQSILIKVWANGADMKGPRRVLLTPRVRPFTINKIVNHVDEVLKYDCNGTVAKLCFPNGIKVTSSDQIVSNGEYVACKKNELFKKAEYPEFCPKNLLTSPRIDRRFLVPMNGRSTNSTQKSSLDHSLDSTQNSNGNRRRGPKMEEDQVFPARPVKHTRSSEKVHNVDLDRDDGGVFRSKKANRTTHGAREVQDSIHTRTEVPVDQMDAREVQGQRPNRNGNRPHAPQRAGSGGMQARANSNRPPDQTRESQRDKYNNMELKRNQSATKIQANYRGYRTRKDIPERRQAARMADEDRARSAIQSRYSGNNARKHSKEETHAATNTQSNYRGHRTGNGIRDRQRDKEESTTKIQTGYHGHQTRNTSREKNNNRKQEREKESATKIQSGYRGHGNRRSAEYRTRLTDEDKAAVKIQSSYRSHRTRRQMRDKLAEDTRKQPMRKQPIRKQFFSEDRDRTKSRTNSPDDEEKAATKIQAGYRGFRTRRQIRGRAATKIQSGYRGNKSRASIQLHGRYDDQMRREEAAATRIQAGFRGHQVRKHYAGRGEPVAPQASRVRVAHHASPSRVPREDSYDELALENHAATKIQSNFRGYRTRKEDKRRRAAGENLSWL